VLKFEEHRKEKERDTTNAVFRVSSFQFFRSFVKFSRLIAVRYIKRNV